MPGKTYLKLPEFTVQQIQRFWAKIDKTPGQGPRGDCWEWRAYANKRSGYGIYTVRVNGTGKPVQLEAHRVAYFLQFKVDPAFLCVCHRCDNRRCVRGKDLFLGTRADNRADCVAKGRQAKGNSQGYYRHPERYQHGEQRENAKLTADIVKEIRAAYTGQRGEQIAFARRLGVHKRLIHNIVYGKSWRHLL